MAVVKINAIHVPAGSGEEVERRFAAHRDAMAGTQGFLGYELLRPVAGEDRYFVYTRWESDQAFQAWRNRGTADAAHAEERQKPVSTGAELLEFEVVLGADGGETS